ncbi:MAG: TVP38/TMEM64 family protein [Alphaproteobacteria bacterium]
MTTLESPASDGRDALPPAGGRGRLWLRWLPIGLIVAGFGAALVFGVDTDSLLDLLKTHHADLTGWVSRHFVLAVLVYALVYAVSIALSVPGGAVLTLVGGFLFGAWAGTAIVVVAATVGATGLFLAARTAVGEGLSRNAGPFVRKMEAGFKRDAFSYLLFLRLTPVFPFWIVNLAPALLQVPLRTYVIATALGIVPGTFVFASFGAGLGNLLAAGDDISVGDVLSLEVILGLSALALLALAPIAFRIWRDRRGQGGAG